MNSTESLRSELTRRTGQAMTATAAKIKNYRTIECIIGGFRINRKHSR